MQLFEFNNFCKSEHYVIFWIHHTNYKPKTMLTITPLNHTIHFKPLHNTKIHHCNNLTHN